MARKNIQSGSEEFELFRDFWEIYKDNAIAENNKAYMEKVVEDTDWFYAKYKTPFAKDLAVALVSEMERKYKHGNEMRSKNTGTK